MSHKTAGGREEEEKKKWRRFQKKGKKEKKKLSSLTNGTPLQRGPTHKKGTITSYIHTPSINPITLKKV